MTGTAISRTERQVIPRREHPVLEKPAVAHGAEIHDLVSRCRPLDLNSRYAYLLLCAHFRDTCVRAESRGETVGFVSAYNPPGREDVIFVWQVAVAASMRGQGLAKAMLRELLGRDRTGKWRFLETTVSPSNTASLRLFHSLAHDLGAPVTESTLFCAAEFGAEEHEKEDLIRIGPIPYQLQRGETQR